MWCNNIVLVREHCGNLICKSLSHVKYLSLFYLLSCIHCSALHRRDVQDSDIDPIIDAVVDGLFSVFVNLGALLVACSNNQATNTKNMIILIVKAEQHFTATGAREG